MSGPQPQNPKSGKSAFNLSGLLDSLLQLYHNIGMQRWRSRSEYQAGNGDNAGLGIQDQLSDHIDITAGEHNTRQAGPVEAHDESAPTSARKGKDKPPRPGLFRGLARHFGRGHRPPGVQPHLAEQMKSQTNDHINRALQLARQGNAGGAKVHTELAEQALRTAAKYMPEDEYAQFKERVQQRLKQISSQ